jgi:hypothetical protein
MRKSFKIILPILLLVTILYNPTVLFSKSIDYDSLVITNKPCVALRGTYTLNSNIITGGRNYSNFNSFIIDLQTCGLDSDVVLNVDSNIYSGKISFNNIPTLSSTHKLIINGNNSKITHTSDATDPTSYVFELANVNNITLKNFTLELGASSTKGSVLLISNSHQCIIENNKINGNLNNTANSFNGINISGNSIANNFSTNASNITIRNNTISGGYNAIYYYGNSTDPSNTVNNVIENNIVSNFYTFGINVGNSSGVVISNNNIHRLTRPTMGDCIGINTSGNYGGVKVSKNKIHHVFNLNSITRSFWGVTINNAGTSSNPNIISNNIIYSIIQTNGTCTGFVGNSYSKFYFNTFGIKNTTYISISNTTGISISYGATGIAIMNNNIYINYAGGGDKICIKFMGPITNAVVNYNNLYIEKIGLGIAAYGFWNNNYYTTFSSWKSANNSGFDQLSVSTDPLMHNYNAGDLKPTSFHLQDLGVPVSTVLQDINGVIRNTLKPDIGAYEFTFVINGLVGSYTVGGAGADFPSLTAVTNELNTNGICGCGPVLIIVNSNSGPYTERLVLNNIRNASSFSQIIFYGNGATIQYSSTNSADRAAIQLNSSRYVTIDSFIIQGYTGTSTSYYSWGIYVTSDARYNTIKNNKIFIADNSNSFNFAGIVFSDNLTTLNAFGGLYFNNVVEKNYIKGGYVGIAIIGIQDGLISNRNIFNKNSINDTYYYGIYSTNQDSSTINYNEFSSKNRSNFHVGNTGIYAKSFKKNSDIIGNRFFDFFNNNNGSANSCLLIWVSETINNQFSSEETIIANNLIYDMYSNVAYTGIKTDNCQRVHIYHNTMIFDKIVASSHSTIGINFNASQSNVFNNNISITRTPNVNNVGLYCSLFPYNSNYNNIYIPTGSIAYRNNTYYPTLSSWRSGVVGYPVDMNSISLDSKYVKNGLPIPTSNSPLINAGTPTYIVTKDILLNPRNATNPYIGAFETKRDYDGPSFQYSPIETVSNINSIQLNNFLTVTDESGVDTTLLNRPRIYFKKKTDPNIFNDNSSTTSGWKYSIAKNGVQPFSFQLDFSKLQSTVNYGDSIQYFIIAKDVIGNISYTGATLVDTPITMNVDNSSLPAANLNAFRIDSGIRGTILVGRNQLYTSLTNTNGFFDVLTRNSIGGNIVIKVTSDIVESGTHSLTPLTEVGVGNYSITIEPNIDSLRVISGNYNGALIRLLGINRVKIDGRYNEVGSYLKFINSSSGANNNAISISNFGVSKASSDIILKNLIIQTNNTTNSVPLYIGCNLDSLNNGVALKNIFLLNNKIFGGQYGILCEAPSLNVSDSIIIENNILGSSNAAEQIKSIGLKITNSKNSYIHQNLIYNIINNNNAAWGIKVNGHFENGIISKNNIKLISSTKNGFGGRGIDLNTIGINENILIINNFISGISGKGDSILNNYGTLGIGLTNTNGVKCYFNSIQLVGNLTDKLPELKVSAGLFIGNNSQKLDIRNNIISNSIDNINTPLACNSYAFYSSMSDTSFLNIDYNNYYTKSSRSLLGYFQNPIYTLTDLKNVFPGKNNNSVSIYPKYNSDTDLHTNNIRLYNKGVNIPTITTDIDNELRNSIQPCIGADEFPLPPVELSIINISTNNLAPCYSNNDSISIGIRNNGANTQNNFKINLKYTGAITDSTIYFYSKSLLSQQTDVVSFKIKQPLTSDTLTILANIEVANDVDTVNNYYSFKKYIALNQKVELGKDTSLCIGDSIVLTINNNGVNYLWSTGDTTNSCIIKNSGEISVLVTNEFGCTSSDTISINFNPLPISTFTIDSSNGRFVEFRANSTIGLLFNWDFGDTASLNNTSNISNPSHLYLSPGDVFKVTLTTKNVETNCLSSTTEFIKLSTVNAINLSKNFNLKAKPNPFINQTLLCYELIGVSNNVSLEVLDILGRKVATILENQKQIQGKYEFEFDTFNTNYKSAIYIVKLSVNGNETFLKVIPNK